jgi:preprotein translocase subunit SecB
MKSAPLSLNVSYPTRINLVSEPEGACDAGYDVACDIEVGQNTTNPRRWRIVLEVKFSAKGVKRPAHKGEVAYVGIFTVAEDYPEDRMPRLVAVNAPSMLYSSIRELVALLTGRGPLRSVLLPTVSFIENVISPLPPEPHVTEPLAVEKGSKRKPRRRVRRKLAL